ncbi:MAG: ATP-binding cassette domain-containing protein [Actinomycetota bacterium]|nr:ATP-binding cassette domain-containing protein [Actinomycetota bacterium]
MGAGPAAVLVDEFGFRYAGRTEWAVRDAEFRIEPGQRILLTGASGSGKSTLLAAMAGLLGPDAGDTRGAVRIDGRAAVQARDRVGILFQDPDSQLVMGRAGDDVAFGLENRGVPAADIWPRVRVALDMVGFGYPLDRSTHMLSGGEKQRLVLAGAMVGEPGLLLLDEPTAQLDPQGAQLVRAAIARILARRGTSLVLIDHDAEPWLPLIDRVLEVQFHPTQGTAATLGTYQGAPESKDSSQNAPESGAVRQCGGVRELATDWRPREPLLPPRVPPSAHQEPAQPSAGHLLPRGSTQGANYSAGTRAVLLAQGAGFSFPEGLTGPHIPAPVRPALAPTDVELLAGSVTAITGPNGSGKSTLGLLLAGLKPPTVGRITASHDLAGRLGDRPYRWAARDLVQRIGTVFQNPEHQFLTGRVRDELSLGPLRAGAGNRAAHDRAAELLHRLGLTGYADANPFTLSGGQQRRLSVATALATRPAVLILDEPTFGQDSATWTELVSLLAEARDAGAAICLISHDARLVSGFADHELRLGTTLPTMTPPALPVDHRKVGGFPAPGAPKTPSLSDDQLGEHPTR